MKIEIDIPDDELRHCFSCESGEMTLTLSINETVEGFDITSIISDTYDGNSPLKYREVKETAEEQAQLWMYMKAVNLVEIVRCKNCIHRPIKDTQGVVNPPKDSRGYEDYTCPCLNEDDYWYSWCPSDEWFCAEGKAKGE